MDTYGVVDFSKSTSTERLMRNEVVEAEEKSNRILYTFDRS